MRIGICASLANLADAKEAGFVFGELTAGAVVPFKDEAEFAPLRAEILSAPLPIEAVNCFVPAQLKVVGPEVDFPALTSYMDITLRRISEIGAKIMVFGSGGARRSPEGFPLEQARAQYLQACNAAGDIAAKYGVTIALEPLSASECNIFNYVSQGIEFVDTVNNANVKLLADMYHMGTLQEPTEYMTDAGARLVHIHIDSPILPGLNGGTQYDYAGFLATLLQTGYTGRLSVEDHSNMLGAEQSMTRLEMYTRLHDYIVAQLP